MFKLTESTEENCRRDALVSLGYVEKIVLMVMIVLSIIIIVSNDDTDDDGDDCLVDYNDC